MRSPAAPEVATEGAKLGVSARSERHKLEEAGTATVQAPQPRQTDLSPDCSAADTEQPNKGYQQGFAGTNFLYFTNAGLYGGC